MTDPLSDTLFRPTTLTPHGASAAPVRIAGTRTRAGNAMNRTRAALLSGAARAVATSGTKITMAQVAAAAGVAKATLYNHFRTREAVLAAPVAHQVDELISAQTGKQLGVALTDAAAALADHPVLRGLRTVEPGALAELARISPNADGWQRARSAIADALAAEGRGGAQTVLRWLASYLISPADGDTIAADVAVLLAGLPGAAAPVARPA
jgi:AcrR family transcriptional regulator